MKKEYQNIVAAYPVIISYEPTEKKYPYFAHIVDFDDDTSAASFEEAIRMARSAIGDEIISMQEENMEIPKASTKVNLENPNDVLTYVDIDSNEFRAKFDNRTVKKSLTIPSYLNELGKEQNINFSELLTNALKERLSANN